MTFATERSKADILLILSNEESFAGVMTTGSATAIGHSAYGIGVGVPLSQQYVYLHIADRETGDALLDGEIEGQNWGWSNGAVV